MRLKEQNGSAMLETKVPFQDAQLELVQDFQIEQRLSIRILCEDHVVVDKNLQANLVSFIHEGVVAQPRQTCSPGSTCLNIMQMEDPLQEHSLLGCIHLQNSMPDRVQRSSLLRQTIQEPSALTQEQLFVESWQGRQSLIA